MYIYIIYIYMYDIYMHLRINNSHKATKNYNGKIYIRKLLTYCNF